MLSKVALIAACAVAVAYGQSLDECKALKAETVECMGACGEEQCADLPPMEKKAAKGGWWAKYAPCYEACKPEVEWSHPSRDCFRRPEMKQCVQQCKANVDQAKSAACKKIMCECVNEQIRAGDVCEATKEKDCDKPMWGHGGHGRKH